MAALDERAQDFELQRVMVGIVVLLAEIDHPGVVEARVQLFAGELAQILGAVDAILEGFGRAHAARVAGDQRQQADKQA